MKRFLSITGLIFSLLWFNSPVNAQEGEDEFCGYEDPGIETQLGGRDLPATDTVRVLIVFIDFPDDTREPTHSTWPVGEGPDFLNTFIDSLPGQSSDHWNFTNFFIDMSFNQYFMVGKTIYQQAQHSLNWYKTTSPYKTDVGYYAARHVIEYLDSTMDFSQFDNWKKLSNYNHQKSADGQVDIVFPVYRRSYNEASGFTVEGYYTHVTSFSVDNGVRTISRWAFTAPTRMDERAYFEIAAHEFGHAWGLPHNSVGGLWTLMGHRSRVVSAFMNSFERELLGWMTFTDVTVNGTNVTIGDFGANAVAYRVRIDADEVYLLENHQCESPYDEVNRYAPDLTVGYCAKMDCIYYI